MKKIALFIFLFGILLSGCKDDEKEKIVFSKESLYQTIWQGSIKFFDEGIPSESDIRIELLSDTAGSYSSEELESNNYMKAADFFYHVDGQVVFFNEGYKSVVEGAWWISEFTGDFMVLKRAPGKEYEAVLTLKKMKI